MEDLIVPKARPLVRSDDGQTGWQKHGLQSRAETSRLPLPERSEDDKRRTERVVRSAQHAGDEAKHKAEPQEHPQQSKPRK